MVIAQAAPAPFTLDWFDLHKWELGVTLGLALLLTVLSRPWVARYRRRAKGGDDAEGRRRRRVATVVGMISGVVVVIAWLVFALTLLKTLGVDITPIVASAGIAGIALGFGAQTIVRDALSGLFIFLEGQYDVGDTVDLTTTSAGTVSGTIEALTVRTTSVRQYDGSLSIVPNGVIEITNNRTRGWGRAVVDVPVALDEDSDRVRQVLEELLDEIDGEAPLNGWLRKPPQVLGVTQLTDSAQVIRIAAETVPSHRIDAERLLRAKVLTRMSERSIKSPPIAAGIPRPPA